MGGVKVDIIWSPNHEDRFVTFGTDLSLFKVENLKEGASKPQGGVKISDDTFASLLSVNTENQFIKCLAWYPKPNPDHLLAVGLANGKVVLSSFGKGGTPDPRGLIGREFVPKHARQCNHLAWNPIDSNLLAEGLDKYRTDHSIFIWDVNSASHDKFIEKRSSADPNAVNKPFVELGPTSEATLSLAWFHTEPKTLVTGMNHKFLKIFDLREIMRPQSMAYTKAVYGVCVDPHFEYRVASFCENSISVWDARNFDKPVLTLQDAKPVMKVSWAPTRSGLLSALHKDSPVVKLYDIQNAPVGADELEPAVIERVVQPHKNHILSSFDWHCTHDNRLLAATVSGVVHDIKVFERISLSWSSDIHMTWACGRQMVQCNTIKLGADTNEDISIKMKRRAQHGYGLQTREIWQNAQLAGNDKPLRNLWHWLHFAQGLHPHEDMKPRRPSPGNVTIYHGIKAVLLGDGSSALRSEPELLHWQGLEGQRFRTGRKIFVSEERSNALQLCGWGFNRNQYQLNDALERLQAEGKYENAAAIALFNLNMKQAIEILQTGTVQKGKSEKVLNEGNLSVVAMALSGFTEDNALWQQLCSKEKKQLKNSYLQTMFAFLTTDPEHYEAMLNESQIEIIDKVAFASMYLSDSRLMEYVKNLTAKLINQGSLDGILLTGLGKDGLDLLEQYIDHTCDIQTACLVALLGMQHSEVIKDPRPKIWIENYRSLLDQWKLWHRRAEFDLYHTSCEPSSRPMPQVFASCNYCGKSVAYNMLATRNRSYIISTTSHRPKVTSCPNCRKPLPRCALCLINMGTPAGQGKPKPSKDSHHSDDSNRKLTQFSEWFTWCQTCRHGGHAHHLMEWFRDHNDCPVTGCNCHCTILDSLGNVSTEMSSPSNRSLASAAV